MTDLENLLILEWKTCLPPDCENQELIDEMPVNPVAAF